ncbi:MAG: hypothetical protein JW747_01290 [Candidatus Aminicenantes bacterium]|nr:hypothetical protein [Candidatus Aminicenantes bacterium]
MNKKTRLGLWVCLILLGGASALCRASLQPTPSDPREELETFLREADITAVEKMHQHGRTNAWLVTLSDGTATRRAFFKSIRRSRPAIMPDSCAYELAAYELDKLLGLGLVPATVERSIEGRAGSLQLFLDGVETEKSRLNKNLRPPDPQAYGDRLDEILVLEHLVFAPRQDLGDVIFQTDSWRPMRVDFSEAFAPSAELLTDYPLRRCSRRVLASLSDEWDDDAVRARLKSLLNAEELEALLQRRLLLLNEIKRLIAEKGEAAVLYRP